MSGTERYSAEHLHLPLQNNILFIKSTVESLRYINLPSKQLFCLNLAVLCVHKSAVRDRSTLSRHRPGKYFEKREINQVPARTPCLWYIYLRCGNILH
ncbi:Succinyl-CoA--D-citramalate CoA-transferase [Fusarium oxysporum f. sp. albedinis]|nr:Succinyl-CoA--D-citramalate CoA-transferase [Fusarium oxysporum f. sp. albedinis]